MPDNFLKVTLIKERTTANRQGLEAVYINGDLVQVSPNPYTFEDIIHILEKQNYIKWEVFSVPSSNRESTNQYPRDLANLNIHNISEKPYETTT